MVSGMVSTGMPARIGGNSCRQMCVGPSRVGCFWGDKCLGSIVISCVLFLCMSRTQLQINFNKVLA